MRKATPKRATCLSLLLSYSALLIISSHSNVSAMHDCVEARQALLQRRLSLFASRRGVPGFRSNRYSEDDSAPLYNDKSTGIPPSSCAGGLCVGMKNGPHKGGNASYPIAWNGTAGTYLESHMTVPELPEEQDGITYYIWTDMFFGDGSLGRMNQLVPQLLLGDVLDGSSGPPEYTPLWHNHRTWTFGAHYFFETLNISTMKVDSHAAYGELFPAYPGETVTTTFELSNDSDDGDPEDDNTAEEGVGPSWILTMAVVGDASRTSILKVRRPYMGLGMAWSNPTDNWLEPRYRNVCMNACWELYGAYSASHLPSSGATYNLTVRQPHQPAPYEFTSWEQDEGNASCPSSEVEERHTLLTQHVSIRICVQP
jgi:hypothetical protein